MPAPKLPCQKRGAFSARGVHASQSTRARTAAQITRKGDSAGCRDIRSQTLVERTKSLIQQVMIKTIKGYSHENRTHINTIGNWIFCSGESWSASSATAASEEWREG